MRLLTLFFILAVISSCAGKREKSIQETGSIDQETDTFEQENASLEQGNETIKQEYLRQGGEIVSLSQSELLKNVSRAMQSGGPGYAIDFCNERALPLKDSLSRAYRCQIRRIALKYRNPADRPQNGTEMDQLSAYQETHLAGESLEPEVHVFDDRIEYYHPIVIDKGTCLVCHGQPGTQIAEETMQIIRERYPEDLATGFNMNDFRGAWKITFMKE
jgi:hypothetical protein